MQNEKLILRPYKVVRRSRNNEVIRVSGEAIAILEEYQRATGLPIKEIASRMIVYAADYTEVAHD